MRENSLPKKFQIPRSTMQLFLERDLEIASEVGYVPAFMCLQSRRWSIIICYTDYYTYIKLISTNSQVGAVVR